MKEIYVIYNNNTGFIGGAGIIDRKWDEANADGSTASERIQFVLTKYSDRKVIYLPLQKVPDPQEHKIKDGKIVKLTIANKKTIENARPKTEIELLKERVEKLESLT